MCEFKAHSMGLTLASKNWQGTILHPFRGTAQVARIDSMQKLEKPINRECITPKFMKS